MKSYINMYEEAMTTASAGFSTGPEIDDDDVRVPSGDCKPTKRTQAEGIDSPEEESSKLSTLSGDDVADKQAKTTPPQAPDGADSSGV